MRNNRLLKQGLAVLISLSMSLGSCAPGSFTAFADTVGVSSEVESGIGEVETDTEEEAGTQGEGGVSEENSEEAARGSVSADVSAGEEASNFSADFRNIFSACFHRGSHHRDDGNDSQNNQNSHHCNLSPRFCGAVWKKLPDGNPRAAHKSREKCRKK